MLRETADPTFKAGSPGRRPHLAVGTRAQPRVGSTSALRTRSIHVLDWEPSRRTGSFSLRLPGLTPMSSVFVGRRRTGPRCFASLAGITAIAWTLTVQLAAGMSMPAGSIDIGLDHWPSGSHSTDNVADSVALRSPAPGRPTQPACQRAQHRRPESTPRQGRAAGLPPQGCEPPRSREADALTGTGPRLTGAAPALADILEGLVGSSNQHEVARAVWINSSAASWRSTSRRDRPYARLTSRSTVPPSRAAMVLPSSPRTTRGVARCRPVFLRVASSAGSCHLVAARCRARLLPPHHATM